MNLSVEALGTLASVGGIILFSIYRFMQNVVADTDIRIDEHITEANQKLENIQTVASYLQGQVVEIQADNIKLLRHQVELEKRDTQREKELAEAKTEALKAQAGESQAKHLQADAEKERDTALAGKAQALELVEIQSKAIQEANNTIAELRALNHAAQLEIAEWKNKYAGSQETVANLRFEVTVVQAPAVVTVPDVVPEPITEEPSKETTP